MSNIEERLFVGWREWASLPDFDIPMIKVKIDTGAMTSSLHAFDIELIKIAGQDYVKFNVHPIQKNDNIIRSCCAKVVGTPRVRSSNGISEKRLVIQTPIRIGKTKWDIKISLTNRDIMKHRMLLGREAMRNLLVDPKGEFHQGRTANQEAELAYYHDLTMNASS